MVCYDVTREDTFKSLDAWLQKVEYYADENAIKILIGNKIDLDM